jgi:hypothetical protein
MKGMVKFNIRKKDRFILGLSAGVLAALVFGGLFLSDLAGRTRKLRSGISVAEAELKKAMGMGKRQEEISADYARYQGYLSIGSMAPRQAMDAILREIERIARDAGTSILNLTPQEMSSAGQKTAQFKAELRMEGSRDQFLLFLNGVQQSRMLIRIPRVAMNAKDEQGTVLKADMLVVLDVF